MSNLWAQVAPSDLSIPDLSGYVLREPLKGSAIAWLPGMKVDTADWVLACWHRNNIKHDYIGSGGEMRRLILHFLTYDAGVINPMWNSKALLGRIEWMKATGVEYIVGLDFSSWAGMPVTLQLYNYYRSAVVNRDLARAGFKVIAHPCWSFAGSWDMTNRIWGDDLPFALIDANHVTARLDELEERLFWPGAEAFVRANERCHTWLWTSDTRIVRLWERRLGPVQWVPSRARMLRELVKRGERQRQAAKAATADGEE